MEQEIKYCDTNLCNNVLKVGITLQLSRIMVIVKFPLKICYRNDDN